MKKYIDLLFLGDIVGRPGRQAVEKYLEKLDDKPDFIIANIENASHGFGLTEKNYHELVDLGINAMTSGNHIWDKKEIFKYINIADKLIRPLNYSEKVPGVGSRIFEINDNLSIGIINILGRVFMSPINSPWGVLEEEVKKIQYETPIVIVDFHAEATAEKICCGYIADRLGVSAVLGTHTHVQTADEKILEFVADYITDVGYCGAYDSIIGMEVESSIKRLITSLPEKYEIPFPDKTEVNGVRILINADTGQAKKIERIKDIIYIQKDKER